MNSREAFRIAPPGDFTVEPNPVLAGGTVKIKGKPNDRLYVYSRGGKTVRVTLDGDGTLVIDVPVPGGRSFTVSNFKTPNGTSIEVDVTGSNKK